MANITVLDNEITILKIEDEDYISLTDMLKAQDVDFLYLIGLEIETPLSI